MKTRVLTNCFGVFIPKSWVTGATVALWAMLCTLLAHATNGPDALMASSLATMAMFGMILDELTEFADAASVAAGAGTALIGDVIDLGSAARDIGTGEPLYLVITVDTEIITGGSAGTIKFLLASDAQAAIATDGSASVHIDTGTFVTDDSAANDSQMNAGSVIFAGALPSGGRVYEQYLGILAVIGTTTVTAGKINAFLTRDAKFARAYKNATNQ